MNYNPLKRQAEDGPSRYPPKRQDTRQDPNGGSSNRTGSWDSYWMVQWRNKQMKKHKTWDGDAILLVRGTYAELVSMEDTRMTSGPLRVNICGDQEFEFGAMTIHVDRRMPREEYTSGICFGKGPALIESSSKLSSSSSSMRKAFVPLKPMVLNPSTPSRPVASVDTGRVYPTASSSNAKYSPPKPTAPESCWTANWRKPQNKKHKTWDGDGYVVLSQGNLRLISESGKILGITKWKGIPLHSGAFERIGLREVELDSPINFAQLPKIIGLIEEEEVINDDWEVPGPAVIAMPATPVRDSPAIVNSSSSAKKFVIPTAASFYTKPAEKAQGKGPLHDPDAEGAVVMKAPTPAHIREFNKKNLPIVPVVLDPILVRRLRPHQIEGVKFLYECTMGLRKHEGQGCILADEMGLGKTLQTITLVWTLLKQNPYAGAGPTIGKAMIVCPVSLVNNWKSEFRKWLGRDRIGVFDGTKDKKLVKQFVNSRIHQVLIIGYEKLRTVVSELAYCQPPIGLIVCDEGHRLKSANNKTSKMFEALRTPRRVILSGTPIQNDLSEFHAMADFCNPGLLDTYAAFKKIYETPILRSRAPECTAKDAEIGQGRLDQLSTVAKSFVLRREATILKNYLPPKTEYVVFVTPTELQLRMFAKILSPDHLEDVIGGTTAESLAMINHLTKISSSPILIKATVDKAKASAKGNGGNGLIEAAAKLLPSNLQPHDVSLSGKLIALAALLRALRRDTDEKCIIVSHFTSTLNVIQAFCESKGYTYHRLDGKTPPAKRQEYVNDFNKTTQATKFVFLLSSKAGGVGLNLIGASRLCLFDSDWNPSHDLQSMARIHRDGQKHPVFIYRFLTAGTIDEKIFQRQVTKMGLSDSLMNAGTSTSKSDSFTRKDLQDIFRVHPGTTCHTHELLDCPCDATGSGTQPPATNDKKDEANDDSDFDEVEQQLVNTFQAASQLRPEDIDKMDKDYAKRKKSGLASLGQWRHIDGLRLTARENVRDAVLRKLLHVPKLAQDKRAAARTNSTPLLDAIDLDSVLAMDEEVDSSAVDVRSLSGGTISFLFEKGTEVAIEPESDEELDGEGDDHGSNSGSAVEI